MTENGFTPTQQAILDVLSDGNRHTREELHACLPDELGRLSNIQQHITNIRKQLRPKGQDLICEYHNRSWYYRHIRLIVK